MKRLVPVLFLLVFGILWVYPQDSIITIPDTAFIQALIIEGVDISGDGLISVSEAVIVKELDVSYKGITDMTGIGGFANLESLYCNGNSFTVLNLTHNTNLRYLDCSGFQFWGTGYGYIEILDISNNLLLRTLKCSYNQLNNLDVSNNKALEDLECKGNQLFVLELSNNVNLSRLDCQGNQLVSLNITSCSFLKILYCGYNQLSNLDVSNNPALSDLGCEGNLLTNLDLSKNNVLSRLECQDNQINNLNFTICLQLQNLYCGYNQLVSLDVSNNPALSELACEGNLLSNLDISKCSLLERLDCNENLITSLDASECVSLKSLHCESNLLSNLKISNVTSLVELNCDDNQLTSLNVSDCASLKYLACESNQLISLNISHCSLLSDLECGYNELGNLDVSECNSLKNLSCEWNRLTNLSTSNCPLLESLDCRFNQLASLDVSNCNSLKYINCSNNQLSGLNISNCSLLEYLDCGINQLVSLDVSQCISLNYLHCENNQLSGLDILSCSLLEGLRCGYNQLSDLDISECISLKYLHCNNNQLSSLDILNCSLLEDLRCGFNQLSDLDISNCSALKYLYCEYNIITALDLSSNPYLVNLVCDANHFTQLQINSNRSLRYVSLCETPTLFAVCIWTRIFPPPGVEVRTVNSPNLYFTIECDSSSIIFPDTSFLYALIDEGVDTDGDSLISFTEAGQCSRLNISGYGISDLMGIQEFSNLDTLICDHNSLNNINLNFNPALRYLDCSFNEIADLDLTGNPSLSHLDCSHNRFPIVQIENNTEITYLDCSNNLLTGLDLSKNSSLVYLDCGYNSLTGLDLFNNGLLEWLYVNHISTLREVCVWTMPFPTANLTVDSAESPNTYFTIYCECRGDYFEDNDSQFDAALLGADVLLENLFVSPEDDDWFQLYLTITPQVDSIYISCNLYNPGGEINLNLVNNQGEVLASPDGQSELKIYNFPVKTSENYFLHIYSDSGPVNSYSLQWKYTIKSPNSRLDISRSDAECDQCSINPLYHDDGYVLDTMKVDLYSGESSEETVFIRNEGPAPYFFYSAMGSPELMNSRNHSILFDGVDGSIKVNASYYLNFYENITLEAWIRTDLNDTSELPIISKGTTDYGYELFISADALDRRIGFRSGGSTIYSKSFIENNRWYHVAVTCDLRTIRIYINGFLDKSGPMEGSLKNDECILFFGTNNFSNETRHFFNGDIDEIRIWNRAREAWEIQAFMNRALSGDEYGLAGYWPMNGESPNLVIDYVSSNHGFRQGGTSRAVSSAPIVDMIKWSPELRWIQPGSEMEFYVQFDAKEVTGGDYLADLQIISHDPAVPDIILPMKLHVTDAPSFSIHPDSVNLGEIVLYATNTIELEVANNGSQTLYIDSVETMVIGSRIMPENAVIEPGEEQIFTVDVVRRTLDHFSGDITFYTNDLTNLQIVPLSGDGAKIVRFPILYQIIDTIRSGKPPKIYYKLFVNESAGYSFTLKPTITTFTLPDELHDRMPRPESFPGGWINTSLYPISSLAPGDSTLIKIILNASNLMPGDYFADVSLEWYNPEYQKAFIPVQLHVRYPVHTEDSEVNDNVLVLFPNPVRDILTMRFNEPGDYLFEVVTMKGQVILQRKFSGSSQSIDFSCFQKGVYFITIRSKDYITTRKIIKLF